MTDFYVTPPEWVTPIDSPSTGWMSPDGVLYPCAPWRHSELAGELAQHWRRSRPSSFPFVDSHTALEVAGWLHIGRKSASYREATGGVFYVRGTVKPSDAQVRVLLLWMDAGLGVVEELKL